MKRIVCIALTLLLFGTTAAVGASYTMNIPVSANTATITVNGNIVSADNFNYKGTIYIPLRSVTEAMGADIGWDQETKTASITLNNTSTTSNSDSDIDFTQIEVGFAWDYHILNDCYDDLRNLTGLALNLYANPALCTVANLASQESAYQQSEAYYKDMRNSLKHLNNDDIDANMDNVVAYLNESWERFEAAKISRNYLGSHSNELELYGKIRSAGMYCDGQEMDFLNLTMME